MTDWLARLPFREIWAADEEFYPGRGLANGGREGDLPTPLCLVVKELRSGRTIRLRQGEYGPFPPYRLDSDSLFLSYNSIAEFKCNIVRGWGQPARSIDLYVEFRHLTNDGSIKSEDRPKGFYSQLGALKYFGEDTISETYKKDMRERIIQGPPFTLEEYQDAEEYCETDVDGLARLATHVIPRIPDIEAALYRGSAMWAFANQEARGIPVDMPGYTAVKESWDGIQCELVTEIDKPFGVYEIEDGKPHWRNSRFAACLRRRKIPWPRHPDDEFGRRGELDIRAQTLREMCRIYPELDPLRELRSSLSQLRGSSLHIGNDGRNRASLFPFASKTSRCQPGSASYIWGPAKFLRFFMTPEPGRVLIHRDYCQQEPVIAAIRSGDKALLAACETGDVYLGIAKQLGFAPAHARKGDGVHDALRDLFKVVVLAILYGMAHESLAKRTNLMPYEAREILARLRSQYRTYWDFSERVVDQAGLLLKLRTPFGWEMICPPHINLRTVRNFPIQSTGAEILRVASILGERRGVRIIAPVHDAVMAEADLDCAEDASRQLDQLMRDASRVVLKGYELSTDVQIVRPGERYYDKRGATMWETVNKLTAKQRKAAAEYG